MAQTPPKTRLFLRLLVRAEPDADSERPGVSRGAAARFPGVVLDAGATPLARENQGLRIVQAINIYQALITNIAYLFSKIYLS